MSQEYFVFVFVFAYEGRVYFWSRAVAGISRAHTCTRSVQRRSLPFTTHTPTPSNETLVSKGGKGVGKVLGAVSRQFIPFNYLRQGVFAQRQLLHAMQAQFTTTYAAHVVARIRRPLRRLQRHLQQCRQSQELVGTSLACLTPPGTDMKARARTDLVYSVPRAGTEVKKHRTPESAVFRGGICIPRHSTRVGMAVD